MNWNIVSELASAAQIIGLLVFIGAIQLIGRKGRVEVTTTAALAAIATIVVFSVAGTQGAAWIPVIGAALGALLVAVTTARGLVSSSLTRVHAIAGWALALAVALMSAVLPHTGLVSPFTNDNSYWLGLGLVMSLSAFVVGYSSVVFTGWNRPQLGILKTRKNLVSAGAITLIILGLALNWAWPTASATPWLVIALAITAGVGYGLTDEPTSPAALLRVASLASLSVTGIGIMAGDYLIVLFSSLSTGMWLAADRRNGLAAQTTTNAPKETTIHLAARDVSAVIGSARNVLVIPGYQVAVDQSHNALADVIGQLKGRKIVVNVAAHPTAGRLPGQINALMAEAGFPEPLITDIAEIEKAIVKADVVLVVGAPDVAVTQPDTKPGTIPHLHLGRAKHVIMMPGMDRSPKIEDDDELLSRVGVVQGETATALMAVRRALVRR